MLLNVERARGLMSDLGVDVLIATTPENVYYVSDYSAWGFWVYRGNTSKKGSQAYAIFSRDTDISPALIPVGSGYTTFAYLALSPSWIEDIYPYETKAGYLGEIPEFKIPSDLQKIEEVGRLQKLVSQAQKKEESFPRPCPRPSPKREGNQEGRRRPGYGGNKSSIP